MVVTEEKILDASARDRFSKWRSPGVTEGALASLIRGWYSQRTSESPPATNHSKEAIRIAHLAQRREVLKRALPFVNRYGRDLLGWFAGGSEVRPADIDPEIVSVQADSEHSRLFRLASLRWSVPVSQGYGRRRRFVIVDRSIEKLIGIFALGDPVFNLSPRDSLVGWTARDRELRLRYVIDAFVLGAMPPYSNLLCGKLVAALTTSRETEKAFCEAYRGRKTSIRKKRENAKLGLLTTSAVFGRSSVYDRLRVSEHLQFLFAGTTKGYGHFHVPSDTFEAMVRLLEIKGHAYAHGNRFGNGPNWKMRVIRVALDVLGLDPSLLNHGFPRGVYVAPLASNYQEFLRGEQAGLRKDTQSKAETIAETIKDRWILPRSRRNQEWREINGSEQIASAINSVAGRKLL